MSVCAPFPALQPGDAVALVAPASFATADWVEKTSRRVTSWGFRPRIGDYVLDQVGFLAGRDEDRAADLNAAIRDPRVRAVVCLLGGCGSHRLMAGVDVAALRRDPKPLVGYSDITALHRVWQHAGVVSLHGAVAGDHADDVWGCLTGRVPEPLHACRAGYGAQLTTSGVARGPLFGGSLEMLARTVGVVEPDAAGRILVLEVNKAAGLGNVDRAMAQLVLSGSLTGIVGVAVGYLQGFEDYVDRGWTVVDVLGDWFARLDVPVLAGLPLGHHASPRTVALGIGHELDANAGTLTALGPASNGPTEPVGRTRSGRPGPRPTWS